MNGRFLTAAILANIITLGHPFFGEVFFFRGIKDSSYPSTMFGDGDITKRLMKGAWHLLTVALLTSAVALYALALTDFFESPKSIARLVSWQYVGFSLIVGFYAIGRPIILIRAPLWIATIGVAVFAWWGTI